MKGKCCTVECSILIGHKFDSASSCNVYSNALVLRGHRFYSNNLDKIFFYVRSTLMDSENVVRRCLAILEGASSVSTFYQKISVTIDGEM